VSLSDDMRVQPLLVEIAIEPVSKADQAKLGIALAGLAAEDACVAVSTDHESGQTILKGASESQLAGKIDRLKGACKFDFIVGAPMAALLEHPTQRAEVEFTYKKIRGPKGDFAAVRLVVEPNEPGKGYRFTSRVDSRAMPDEYILGVKEGLEDLLPCGVVAGFPVVDVKVELIDGKYHDVDSSHNAFRTAARAAFREALLKANSVLLEPIMALEITTPHHHVGAIIADLKSRRAHIDGQEACGDAAVIKAMAPLMTMFGYDGAVRTISEGRALFSLRFDHYAPAPPSGDDPPFRPAIGMRA
jgi:elongation factor G